MKFLNKFFNISMKKLQILLFLFIFAFANGCDTHTTSTIKVVNNSTHDLKILFNSQDTHYIFFADYPILELKVDSTSTFVLKDFGPSKYRRPNDEVMIVTFFELHTGDLI